MKRESPKHAARRLATRPAREALKTRVQRCEFCLKPAAPEWLDCHELVPGNHRTKALDQDYALLCVTRLCHGKIEQLTIPNQLAYLYLARPSDFDLEKYYKLIGRRWPDWDEVSFFVTAIIESRFVEVA
jgi:hypothetical protein